MKVKLLSMCLLFLLAVQLSGLAHAKPRKSHRITVTHGLSQSTVYSITQDHSGFIWFATGGGVDIYDGNNIKYLRHDANNPNSLSDNYARALFPSHDGTMWIGTDGGGVNRIDYAANEYTRITSDVNDSNSLISDNVYALFEDKEHNLWIGTDKGLSILSAKNQTFTNYQHDPNNKNSIVTGTIRAIYQTDDGEMWLGSANGGISRLNPITRNFKNFTANPIDPNALPDNSINCFFQSKDKRFWIGSEYAGLIHFDFETQKFKRIAQSDVPENSLNDSEVTSIIEGPNQTLWLGTWSGGINIYDVQSDRVENITKSLVNPRSLSSNSVISMFVDQSHSLWVGTFDNGANKLSLMGDSFAHYIHDPLAKSGPPSNMIWSFAEHGDGVFWIGTKNGLARFNQNTDAFTTFTKEHKIFGTSGSHDVRALLKDGKALWVGTYGGLVRHDLLTEISEVFNHDPSDPTTISSNKIRLIHKATDGSLWIGTQNGLNRFDPLTNEFTRFLPSDRKSESLPHQRIRSLYEDRKGELWIGTSHGLSLFNKQEETFKTWDTDNSELPDNDVRSIYEDAEGVMWIGTQKGLSRFEIDTNSMTTYRESNGLANDTIYALIEAQDNFWLTTNRGLSQFNPALNTFTNYYLNDGLQSNEFNFNAALKAEDGTIFVGGINGFNTFNPAKLNQNNTPPKVHLKTHIFENTNDSVSYHNTDEIIQMSSNDDRVIFELTNLHFLHPEKNKILYKLDGTGEDWNEIEDTAKNITYSGLSTNLWSKDFTFLYEAVASNGISSGIFKQPLRISPPSWQKPWWLALYFLATLGLTIYFIRYIKSQRKFNQALIKRQQQNQARIARQQNSLERQAEKLHELLQFKNNFYQRASHELRTPITLIKGPIDILLENATEKTAEYLEVAQRSANRLQRLTEQMLEVAKTETEIYNADSTFDLRSFVEPIINSFQFQGEQSSISIEYTPIPSAAITTSAEILEDFLYNLLSNAVKYCTPNCKIKVTTTLQEDWLQIIVEDDGVGIPKDIQKLIFEPNFRSDEALAREIEGSGLGLAIVNRQIREIGGSIEIKDSNVKGSTFTIKMPCQWTLSESNENASKMKSAASLIQEHLIQDTQVDDKVILVIEDDADMLSFLAKELGKENKILEAPDAQTGFKLLNKQHVDMVISDVMLPDQSGFEIAKQLKEDESTWHIPVLLLTAYTDRESKTTGLQSYADDYISKPFDLEHLKLRIRNLAITLERRKKWYRKEYLEEQQVSSPLENHELIAVNKKDQDFLARLYQVTEEMISNSSLTISDLAGEVGQGEQTLRRKLRTLLGITPKEYLLSVRMRMAREGLNNGYSVKEVAYSIGYSDQTHFSKVFKNEHGVPPSQYKNSEL